VRKAGRGDVAVSDSDRCVAAKTVKTGGWGVRRLHAGPRCRLIGRVPTEYGRVCASHHVNGFVPFVEEPLSEGMAMRMRAVVGE
jgi:hypothetical protein